MDEDYVVDTEAYNHPALKHLRAGEVIHAIARAKDSDLLVTDKRIAVVEGERIALDILHEGLRRIQFDIEADRPATLVIVPHSPIDEPALLAVPPESYDEVTEALAVIGRFLNRKSQP